MTATINRALKNTIKSHCPTEYVDFIEEVATRNIHGAKGSERAFGIDICDEHVIKQAVKETVRFIELLKLTTAEEHVITWHVIAPPLTRKAAIMLDFDWHEVFAKTVNASFSFDYIDAQDECSEKIDTGEFVHVKSNEPDGELKGMYGLLQFEQKAHHHALSMFEIDEMVQARCDWQSKIVGMIDVPGLDVLIVCLRLIHELRSVVNIQREAHLPQIAKYYLNLFDEYNQQAKSGTGSYGVVVQMSKTEERLLSLLPKAKTTKNANEGNVVSLQETLVDHYLSFFD